MSRVVSPRGIAALVTASLLNTLPVEAGARPSVAVGGVAGFADLADPAASTRLREHRARSVILYIHDYAWTRSLVADRRKVLALFGQGQDVEFGLMPDPSHWFHTVYRTQYTALGVTGHRGHVNGVKKRSITNWRRFVDAARQQGFVSIAPVAAPNSGQYVEFPFASSYWDFLRAAAVYGGGLTTDCPSDFFLTQPAGYRTFVMQELRWGKSAHLHTAFIVSPGQSGVDFLARTQDVLAELQTHGALPDEFIVENYEATPRRDYPNVVGPEGQKGAVASVALWLLLQMDTK